MSQRVSTEQFTTHGFHELSLFEYSGLFFQTLVNNKYIDEVTLDILQQQTACNNNGSEQCKQQKAHRELMQLCWHMSLFITSPNQSICEFDREHYTASLLCVLHNDLNYTFFHHEMIEVIVSYLVHSSNYLKWVPFTQFEHEAKYVQMKYQSQVEFSMNDHIASFPKARQDYVNVRTPLLPSHGKMVINVYCMGKGDEMWLGLVEQSAYKIDHSLRSYPPTLFYYGGRASDIRSYGGLATDKCGGWAMDESDCNHGGIQGTEIGVVKHPLDCYAAGDWINFEIDFDSKRIVFYKNGIRKYESKPEHFPKQQCYFLVHLDTKRDVFYVEQAIVPK